MDVVRLGRSDLMVSRVGFGGAALGGHDYGPTDEATGVAAIHRALDVGINFFDTADVYGFGRSERILGRALAGHPDAVVATKVGVRWDDSGQTKRDLSASWVREALEQSLRRLGLETLPLYQLHWPDARVPIEDAVGTLVRCREAGLVRCIGVCNVDADLLARAMRVTTIDSVQLSVSLLDRANLALAARASEGHGATVQAYNVLARGLLSGKYAPGATFEGGDTRRTSEFFASDAMRAGLVVVKRLRELGARRGASPTQMAIRWALQQPGVGIALAGIKTPEQAEHNAAVPLPPLDPHEMQYLERPLDEDGPDRASTAAESAE